jgi:hypothetical protein
MALGTQVGGLLLWEDPKFGSYYNPGLPAAMSDSSRTPTSVTAAVWSLELGPSAPTIDSVMAPSSRVLNS